MPFALLSRLVRPFGLLAVLVLGAPAAIAATPAGVTVSNTYFRLITPQVPAGGYFTLHNGSTTSVILKGALSPGCGSVMLHRTQGDQMMAVGTVIVPPGGTLAFAPGGYHLMCMNPVMTLGTPVPVTLLFGGGARLDASAAVIGARDAPPSIGR